MLDSVVELLARTNGLATGRPGATEREVAGIYTALEAVHSEYVGIFDMVRRAIVAGEPVKDIAQTLLLRRPEEDCERTAILAHMRLLLADTLGSDAHPFLDAVSTYFLTVPLSGQGSVAMALRRAVEQAHRADDDALHARAEIAWSTRASLRSLQRQWETVCRAHAKLGVLPEWEAAPAATEGKLPATAPLPLATVGMRKAVPGNRGFLAGVS